jgi:2-dehydro-3-deoxygluconokinase
MKIELRKDFTWSLVVPTSMGIRITPANGQPVHCSDTFTMHATSAETNVASISSYLGLPVKVLTTFVRDSPIARFIKDNLAGTLNVKDFNLQRLFGKEGVQILHLSGLIAALSPETSNFCLELARAAKKHGTRISFDLNYRATFWKNREKELAATFREIAGLSDILVGNEEDFQLALGIEGPEEGGKDLASKIDNFKEMITRVRKAFPEAYVFATTLRQVISTNEHLWGAIMLEGEKWHVVEPREIHVLDRIGGGDGFVGGLLYAILKGWEPDKWIQFGWATGALATTVVTDYGQPADEEQVWSIWKGNARVKR